MNKKIKIFVTLGVIFCVLLSTLIVRYHSRQTNTIQTNSGAVLSNKKIGWGIKRNDNNLQPDLGEKNKQILDRYEGIALGNADKKIVYLTFDEGYEAGYTSKILDTLKENNVKATFFITGAYLNRETELVRRMVDEGHIVGNHTVNHPSMPDITDDKKLEEEIMSLHKSVYEKTGYEMQYIRPPMGEYSERTLEISKRLGYTTVMWSFAYDDWNVDKQKGTEYAKQKILDNLHCGSVILLHAVSKDNCEVLDECIKEIKNRGYEIKSIDEFER